MIDINFDRQHLWHPYTSMLNPLPTYPVVSAHGVRLKLEDGRELIDGMSSWWSVIHGYNHPRLNAAVIGQVEKMSHVMFGGLTHAPAVELGKLLVQISPAGLEHVFFSDSGSVSIEVAIKMAFQYWLSLGMPQKNRLLSLRSGYHGDTFMAMSVCDPKTGMHNKFENILPRQFFAPAPQSPFHCDVTSTQITTELSDFRDILDKNHQHIAAVILEPIVQGAGRMFFYHPHLLREIRELCSHHGVLLIADEIATGFGRTGKLFACEHANITPDILCLGKTLTGGYMTLAATLATSDVATTLSEDGGVFMHGPTYMGNPLACAVATESIRLLIESPWEKRIKNIEDQLLAELSSATQLSSVKASRVLGAIGVLEMHKPIDIAAAQKFFVDKGVWIRPFGHIAYIMPPYCIGSTDLSCLTAALVKLASEL
jgi:adenosylmethionine-8-amino-7-oxononanoate aminotransferase